MSTVSSNFNVLTQKIEALSNEIRERMLAEQQLQESETRLRNLAATLEQRVQQRTAELERSNDDLNQFAYVASHDLKAPLRNIEQLAGFVIDDAATLLPARSQKHLAQLRERVKRMDQLLDDLLTYARIGRADQQVELIAVDTLLAKVETFLAPPSGFHIQCIGTMPTLYTQRVPFELVMRNLISNAIKHHHAPSQGTVEITVADLGDYFEFRFRDNGPGIDPKYHERIFGLFQTLKPRDQVGGSGMGLAVVKKVVERQGGTVRVESTVNVGTTFIFTWPKQIHEYSIS